MPAREDSGPMKGWELAEMLRALLRGARAEAVQGMPVSEAMAGFIMQLIPITVLPMEMLT